MRFNSIWFDFKFISLWIIFVFSQFSVISIRLIEYWSLFIELEIDFLLTGKSWQDKVKDVIKEMESKNASLLLLTALDDIACNAVSFQFKIPQFNSIQFDDFILKGCWICVDRISITIPSSSLGWSSAMTATFICLSTRPKSRRPFANIWIWPAGTANRTLFQPLFTLTKTSTLI